MKSTKFLLDLQKKTGLNDSDLAKSLGITKQAVSNYKHGQRVMDDETCGRVALALDVDPMLVVGAACIDRAEKTGQKSIWEVFMSRMAATAASAILALMAVGGLVAIPSDAYAIDGSKTSLSARTGTGRFRQVPEPAQIARLRGFFFGRGYVVVAFSCSARE